MTQQSTPAPVDLYGAVGRHRGRIIVWCLLGGLAAWGASVLMPKQYLSEGKLFVRLGRESVTLDPTATTGQVVQVHESRDAEINSIQEMLGSRVLLEELIDEIGPEAIFGDESILRGHASSVSAVQPPPWYWPTAGGSNRDQAIKLLDKRLDVQLVKNSRVIRLQYENKSPELAQFILERLIELARQRHLAINRSAGSQHFFAEQSDQRGERLAQLQQQLRDMKDQTGLANLVQQRELALEQIGSLESQRLEAASGLAAAQAEVKGLRELLADVPMSVVASETTGLPNTASAGMREQLYSLQLREKELTSKFQEESVEVKQIRQQIADAEKVLKDEKDKLQVTRALNQTYQTLEVLLHNRLASVVSLQAQVSALEGQLAEQREAVKTLNQHELTLNDLELQIELEKANYKRYAEKLEQARIDQALASESLSNLSVLQSPTVSWVPSRPWMELNLGIGLLCGLVLGVAGAVRRDARAGALPAADPAHQAVPALLATEIAGRDTNLSAVAGNGTGHGVAAASTSNATDPSTESTLRLGEGKDGATRRTAEVVKSARAAVHN